MEYLFTNPNKSFFLKNTTDWNQTLSNATLMVSLVSGIGYNCCRYNILLTFSEDIIISRNMKMLVLFVVVNRQRLKIKEFLSLLLQPFILCSIVLSDISLMERLVHRKAIFVLLSLDSDF